MTDYPIIAFSEIDGKKHFPNPRSIIQIALSDYRNSNLTDRELADHICNSLSLVMNDFCMVIDNIKSFELIFKSRHPQDSGQ